MNYTLDIHGANRVPIPLGLPELVSDIAREVIFCRPINLISFIAEYLETRIRNRTKLDPYKKVFPIAARVVQNVFEKTEAMMNECGIDLYTAENAAIKIQAAFRGYYVRKSLAEQKHEGASLDKKSLKDEKGKRRSRHGSNRSGSKAKKGKTKKGQKGAAGVGDEMEEDATSPNQHGFEETDYMLPRDSHSFEEVQSTYRPSMDEDNCLLQGKERDIELAMEQIARMERGSHEDTDTMSTITLLDNMKHIPAITTLPTIKGRAEATSASAEAQNFDNDSDGEGEDD